MQNSCDERYVNIKDGFYLAFLRRCLADTNTLCIHRHCFDECGGFDEEMRRLQDWEYILRLSCEDKYKIAFLNECLAESWIQQNSVGMDDNRICDAIIRIVSKNIDGYANHLDCFNDMFINVVVSDYQAFQNSAEFKDKLRHLALAIYGGQNEALWRLLERINCINKQNEHEKNENYKALENVNKAWEKDSKIIYFANFLIDDATSKKKLIRFIENHSEGGTIIYGWGILGKLLANILSTNEITVEYVIDRKADELKKSNKQYRFVTLDDAISSKEKLVIVTTVVELDTILDNLHCDGFKNVVTLSGVINAQSVGV